MYTFGLISAASTASVEENLHTLEQYARQAKELGCSALCFPECFLTGYLPKEAAVHSISVTDDKDMLARPLETIRSLAMELSMDLLVGFMECKKAEIPEYYITHGIFLSDGSIRYYHKSHLGTREAAVFTPGNALDVFTLSCGIKIGMQICVETHFNDITQTLSLKGAQLIFAPHAVPRAAGDRNKLWSRYIPARSYDNGLYMACCNQWDPEKFAGGILVTDARGEVLVSDFEDAPSMAIFSMDPESISRKHYFPNKRRTELYL